MVLVGEEMIIQQWKVYDVKDFRCKFNYIINGDRYFSSDIDIPFSKLMATTHVKLQSNFKLTLKGYNGKLKDRLLNRTN